MITPGLLEEFRGAPIGDLRLQRRLNAIGNKLAIEPAATFPDAMGSSSELEAFYRFVNNPRVEPSSILEPHIQATVKRIAEGGRTIVVAHDTTGFAFDGPSGEALGYVPQTARRGFWGHFALAVGKTSEALGVLGLETLFFEKRIRGVIRRNRSAAAMMYAKRKNKASLRWDRMVERTRALLPNGTTAIHVMDCEADNYRLFSAMRSAGDHFVVRARHERRAARASEGEDWEKLDDVAHAAPFVCEREVPLSKRRRRPKLNATYGPREARVATLQISATPVIIKKPRKWYAGAVSSLSLNLVQVREVQAPKRGEPVEWLLLTTEPIGNQAEVETIVDWYRRRWRIEEFFKAIKTGCAYERRQLESRAALLRTLSLLVPVAWQLLAVRDAVRVSPRRPARAHLRASQLVVLRALTNNRLSRSPTIEQALLAIAAQGGHLRQNGPPGWQTLGRGMEKLWWVELGYCAALHKRRKK